MGWYSCYTALRTKNLETAKELATKFPDDFHSANITNMRNQRKTAWKIAEKKVQEDLQQERIWNK